MIRRSAFVFFLIAIASAQLTAQLQAPLNSSIDPFSIKRGSSFAASGGSLKGVAKASEYFSKSTRIAADINEAEQLIRCNYAGGRESAEQLAKSALAGMLRSLDPHSNYYDAAEWKDLLDEERSGYTGIGATISTLERAGVSDTYILSTFPGSPAARAHLAYGDQIIAINGEKMAGKNSDIVRDKMRGGTGTVLHLTVERAATDRIETVDIRRNRHSDEAAKRARDDIARA